MYIAEGVITGYKYEVWYSGSCLHEDDEVFDTEEEAREEAEEWCRGRLEQWEGDGATLDGTELEDLYDGIVIEEVFEDDE